jgi:hypothetical protein
MTRKRTSENDLVVSAGAASTPNRRKSPVRTRVKHAPISGEIPEEVTAETPAAPAAVTASDEPSREQIALLAYLYWESRGGQGGSSEEDWLRAEQELRVRSAAAVA